MRKFLILLSLWLGLTVSVFAAETLTLTLTDGTSVTGDSGKTFLEILDDGQRKNITVIPDVQRKAPLGDSSVPSLSRRRC